MIRLLLTICLACLPSAVHADEVADLKVALAIAEVRAQRLESLLESIPAASGDVSHVPAGDESVRPIVASKDAAQPAVVPQFTTRQVRKQTGTQRVKQCINGVCSYRIVPVYGYVTEQVPVAATADSAADYATPLDVGGRILEFMRPSKPETLLDLGSGDGRMVVFWALRFGHPAVGIESDPARVELARNFARVKGVSHLVTFIEGDFKTMEWPAADVIYVYQFDHDLAAISDRLSSAKRVVSYAHRVPGLSMTSHNNGEFFSWQKPQPRPVAKSVPSTVYGGKVYTPYNLPSGGRCNCYPMCQTIKAALRAQGANI